MEAKMTKQQKWLIDQINKALNHNLYKNTEWRTGVYFDANTMNYLYIDRHVDYEAVQSLIESDVLVFVGQHRHQGLRMMRYELNQNQKQNNGHKNSF